MGLSRKCGSLGKAKSDEEEEEPEAAVDEPTLVLAATEVAVETRSFGAIVIAFVFATMLVRGGDLFLIVGLVINIPDVLFWIGDVLCWTGDVLFWTDCTG